MSVQIDMHLTIFGNQKTHEILVDVFNNLFDRKHAFSIVENKIVSNGLNDLTDKEVAKIKKVCSIFDLVFLMYWMEESQGYGYIVEYFPNNIFCKMEFADFNDMKTEKDIADFLHLNNLYDLPVENIMTSDDLPC
jgi:hypothetical protein